MSARIEPLSMSLEGEFLVCAERDGHSLSGTETGLHRALWTARTLSLTGWRVTVEGTDPWNRNSRFTYDPAADLARALA